MIGLLLLAAQAIANPECDRVKGATANDQCLLQQSLSMPEPVDCKKKPTQTDANVCSYRDYLYADMGLNLVWVQVNEFVKAYGDKNARQPGGELTLLLDSQRAWLTYRDKECEAEGKQFEGGTIQALIVNSCRIEITKFRTHQLQKQFLETK